MWIDLIWSITSFIISNKDYYSDYNCYSSIWNMPQVYQRLFFLFFCIFIVQNNEAPQKLQIEISSFISLTR